MSKDSKLPLPPPRQPGQASTQGLQAALGHEFASADLLEQALTHRSHSLVHNERLEFLGDSVLNCIVASLLFDKFGKIDEGDLSRLRANLVKQQSLYEIAQRLELSQYLRLGEGELKSGGFRRPSILADTVEALFGAVFLDGGFEAARATITRLYRPILATVDPKTLGKDSKTLLQEYLQSRKLPLPTYAVTATHGAAHNQEFEVECVVAKLAIQVQGSGGSRRAAEQAAAKKALEQALALALSAGKRARKPRQSQLSLPVAVEQAPAAVESPASLASLAPAEAEPPQALPLGAELPPQGGAEPVEPVTAETLTQEREPASLEDSKTFTQTRERAAHEFAAAGREPAPKTVAQPLPVAAPTTTPAVDFCEDAAEFSPLAKTRVA